MENNICYHEIDFLLPAQRFNINFSYVTQKGLPFVREFVLRLVHLAPMTMSQVAGFFAFSRNELTEAVEDLVVRGELTLSEHGRLTLTDKSAGYFTEAGEVPRLSLLRDSMARLSFDLATFSCVGKENIADKWRCGLPIKVNDASVSQSESIVQTHFQTQFHQILAKGYLSMSVTDEDRDSPNVYTVNSVNKIKQMPIRLPVCFAIDGSGRSVEREDFELLQSSDYVQEQISVLLARLTRPGNFGDIAQAMAELGDQDTLKIFDSGGGAIHPAYLEDLLKLESNGERKRSTFLGPIYSAANWSLVQKLLAPLIKSRREATAETGDTALRWLAPSDPYWGKSGQLPVRVSELLSNATTKNKRLYLPVLHLPVSAADDFKTARQWKWEFDSNAEALNGLVEGFLGGNVEVLHFEGEFVAVIYHISLPSAYPVTVPVGFITTDEEMVARTGRLLSAYLGGRRGNEQPNDCGPLSRFGRKD